MLSLARKTLNRVPSFQDILQGRMTHPDVYVSCLFFFPFYPSSLLFTGHLYTCLYPSLCLCWSRYSSYDGIGSEMVLEKLAISFSYVYFFLSTMEKY